MVTHGQAFDPFWALVQKGAQAAAKDFNVNLVYHSPSTTDPQADRHDAAVRSSHSGPESSGMQQTISAAGGFAPPQGSGKQDPAALPRRSVARPAIAFA